MQWPGLCGGGRVYGSISRCQQESLDGQMRSERGLSKKVQQCWRNFFLDLTSTESVQPFVMARTYKIRRGGG